MMDDATRLIGEGTRAYPLDAAAAAAEESCPHCQTTIPSGEQFCPRCGFQRGSWREGVEEQAPAAAVVEALYRLVSPEGFSWPLGAGESVIGRGDVALKLDDAYASRQHARFEVSAEQVTVTDLGSANGTFIGERKLDKDEQVELSVGETVTIGQTALTLERVEPAAKEAEADAGEVGDTEEETAEPGELSKVDEEEITALKSPTLAQADVELTPAPSPWLLEREGAEERFYLPFGQSVLGRKPASADIVVRGDGYISGKHCQLVATAEHLELTDLGSTNGTYVNGERAEPSAVVELSAGDKVRLGQTDMTVVFEEGVVATEAAETGGDAEAAPAAEVEAEPAAAEEPKAE